MTKTPQVLDPKADISEINVWKVNRNDLIDLMVEEKKEAIANELAEIDASISVWNAGPASGYYWYAAYQAEQILADKLRKHPDLVNHIKHLSNYGDVKVQLNGGHIYNTYNKCSTSVKGQHIIGECASHHYDGKSEKPVMYNAARYKKTNIHLLVPGYGASITVDKLTLLAKFCKEADAKFIEIEDKINRSIFRKDQLAAENKSMTAMKNALRAKLTKKALSNTKEGKQLLEGMRKTIKKPLCIEA